MLQSINDQNMSFHKNNVFFKKNTVLVKKGNWKREGLLETGVVLKKGRLKKGFEITVSSLEMALHFTQFELFDGFLIFVAPTNLKYTDRGESRSANL